MKVFEVITETHHDKEVIKEVSYVTSSKDTIKSISDHFTIHCNEYEKDLKGVREVLVISEHIEG